ncbi:SH3 domain-containing protein [Bacillus spizizenii]|nr:SH3 domain-containing protein [Bacillus spizizenii]
MNKLKMLSTLTVMIASLLIFSSHALAAQYYTVSTSSGAPVNMRSGPGTNWAIVTTIPSGTRIPIYCYKTGTTVTGKYGMSNIWNYTERTLASGEIVPGFVSDTYMYTGSDGPVVPKCSW